MRRVILLLLAVVAAGYLSVLVSGRTAEDRVAQSISADLRTPGGEPTYYVWPSAAPDTASILQRNGLPTRECTDGAAGDCYPAVYLHRSVPTWPFVAHVRWQYSRDQHGVGGTRRFFCFFGFVRELDHDLYFVQ
jgi:hypothetical protein